MSTRPARVPARDSGSAATGRYPASGGAQVGSGARAFSGLLGRMPARVATTTRLPASAAPAVDSPRASQKRNLDGHELRLRAVGQTRGALEDRVRAGRHRSLVAHTHDEPPPVGERDRLHERWVDGGHRAREAREVRSVRRDPDDLHAGELRGTGREHDRLSVADPPRQLHLGDVVGHRHHRDVDPRRCVRRERTGRGRGPHERRCTERHDRRDGAEPAARGEPRRPAGATLMPPRCRAGGGASPCRCRRCRWA